MATKTPAERTLETLKVARRLVDERWFKGSYFGYRDGQAKCCALGAVGLATVEVEEGREALKALLAKMDASYTYASADAAAADAAAAAYASAAAYADADADAADAAADARNSIYYRKRADGYRVGPILRECVGGSVVSFNDADETTEADVLKAFDCAIKKAEAAKGA